MDFRKVSGTTASGIEIIKNIKLNYKKVAHTTRMPVYIETFPSIVNAAV